MAQQISKKRLDQLSEQLMMSKPGKRGIDIPGPLYDRIYQAAKGVTNPLWGRPPTSEQMQHMYNNNLHHPEQIKDFYGQMQHPHSQGMKVGEYDDWKRAYKLHQEHK